MHRRALGPQVIPELHTRPEMAALLGGAGFQVTRLTHLNAIPFPLIWAKRKLFSSASDTSDMRAYPAPVDWGYNPDYAAFNWRGWIPFGCGALGDMACHTVNMPFRAMKLGYPTAIELEVASRVYPETFPLTSRIRFDFPERDGLPPCKFWWYDGSPGDKDLAQLVDGRVTLVNTMSNETLDVEGVNEFKRTRIPR